MKKHQHKPVNLGMARDNIRIAFSPELLVILVQFQVRTAIAKPG